MLRFYYLSRLVGWAELCEGKRQWELSNVSLARDGIESPSCYLSWFECWPQTGEGAGGLKALQSFCLPVPAHVCVVARQARAGEPITWGIANRLLFVVAYALKFPFCMRLPTQLENLCPSVCVGEWKLSWFVPGHHIPLCWLVSDRSFRQYHLGIPPVFGKLCSNMSC